MKKLITMTIMVLAVAAAMAQAPEKFTYQAVVRNASNSLVANASVGVRVSILQGSATGSAVYSETHVATTNANGLVTLSIGGGNVQQGAFADIDWANGPFFLKSETDPNGGSNYSITTTQEMLSVPYALYAKEAGNIPTVPANVSAFTNDAGYLTTAQCGNIDICDLAELVAQLQQQVATLQQQIDSLQGQSGQDTTTNPIDTTTILLPNVFTSTASNITSTSAMVGGNVTSDGGASVIARGVCWSTSQNPTVNDSHTTDGGGMGSFTSNIMGLAANTIYYVRAYATNSAGTAYGEEVTFTTLSAGGTAVIDEKSCPAAPTVTDHEGNVYATVQIGNQCWMRDNLRTTTSPSTGTYLIPAANANYTNTGKQARWYNNDPATYAPMNYGLLYNWNAAVDTFNTAYGETSVNTSNSNAVSVTFIGPRRGICPAGWHLPSDAEWTQLTNYVSSQSDYVCGSVISSIAKALAGTTGWSTSSGTCDVGNDPSLNNATGFSAVPAGVCINSQYESAGFSAVFWSSAQTSTNAWCRALNYYDAHVSGGNDGKRNGFSVRCLRD